MTDRVAYTIEKYNSKAYNAEVFKGIWAEDPRKLKLKRGLLYLLGDSKSLLDPIINLDLTKEIVST